MRLSDDIGGDHWPLPPPRWSRAQDGEGLRDALTEAQSDASRRCRRRSPRTRSDAGRGGAGPRQRGGARRAGRSGRALSRRAPRAGAGGGDLSAAGRQGRPADRAERGHVGGRSSAAALDRQDFDPSVLVLMSGFPTVIERMADDLDWTERLGNAMLAQDEDVLAAVQRMRAEADAAGNLTQQRGAGGREGGGPDRHPPGRPRRGLCAELRSGDDLYDAQPRLRAVSPARRTSPDLSHNPLVAGALAFGAALLVQELFEDDDDDDDNRRRWDDYWGRARPIDWRDRQFYPRPSATSAGRRWAQERDRYWDAQRSAGATTTLTGDRTGSSCSARSAPTRPPPTDARGDPRPRGRSALRTRRARGSAPSGRRRRRLRRTGRAPERRQGRRRPRPGRARRARKGRRRQRQLPRRRPGQSGRRRRTRRRRPRPRPRRTRRPPRRPGGRSGRRRGTRRRRPPPRLRRTRRPARSRRGRSGRRRANAGEGRGQGWGGQGGQREDGAGEAGARRVAGEDHRQG